jgi:hypothetical protein
MVDIHKARCKVRHHSSKYRIYSHISFLALRERYSKAFGLKIYNIIEYLFKFDKKNCVLFYSAELLCQFLAWIIVLRSTKINNFYHGIFLLSVIQQVFWFEVAMYNLFLVTIIYGFQHLCDNIACSFLIEKLFFNNAVEQLSSRAILRHYIKKLLVIVKLINLYDVWMVLCVKKD